MATSIRVLLIDGANDGLTIPIARALARAQRYDVHCITRTPDHNIGHSRRVRTVVEPLACALDLVAAVRRYHRHHPIDVVLPVQEDIIRMAGAVADEIRSFTALAPIPGVELCEEMDDKWAFHRLLERASIRTPRSMMPGDPGHDGEVFVSGGSDGYLVKPTRGFSGIGIEHYGSVDDALRASATWTADAPPMIQEFVPGDDFGCSFLAVDGEVIVHTVQHAAVRQAEPYRSGLGLRFVDRPDVAEPALELARFTSFSGVANVDIRVDAITGEPFVLECNPRYWGTQLGALAMGVNYPDLHCRLALGETPEIPAPAEGFWYNTHAISGMFSNVHALGPKDVWPVTRCYARAFAADPQLEAYLIARTARWYLQIRNQARRSATVTRGVRPQR